MTTLTIEPAREAAESLGVEPLAALAFVPDAELHTVGSLREITGSKFTSRTLAKAAGWLNEHDATPANWQATRRAMCGVTFEPETRRALIAVLKTWAPKFNAADYAPWGVRYPEER